LHAAGYVAAGIDINKSLLAAAPPQCFFGDVRQIPAPAKSFDYTICIDVLEHIPNYPQAIAEIARVTRKAAFVEITTTQEKQNLYADPTHVVFLGIDQWKAELHKYGLPVQAVLLERTWLCRPIGARPPAPIKLEISHR
jgi:ubiquinone/menaquinone biosynthesis C-methylase UbiE